MSVWPSIRRERDGILLTRSTGQCRFATPWETFRYKFFGIIPAWLIVDSDQ